MIYTYTQAINNNLTACYEVDRKKKALNGVYFISKDKEVVQLDEFTIPSSFLDPKIETVPFEITKIKEMFLSDVKDVYIQKLVINSGIKSLAQKSFYKINFIEEVILPDTITQIPAHCFRNMTSLKKITLPSKLKSINMYSFNHTKNLNEVDIPASCRYIGNLAFAYSGIESITIPDKLDCIDFAAFQGCYNLKSVIWPAACSIIPEECFISCRNLSEVTFSGVIDKVRSYAFQGTKVKVLNFSKNITSPMCSDCLEMKENKPIKVVGPFYEL